VNDFRVMRYAGNWRSRRYWWVTGYFSVVGPIVVVGWCFLMALGSIQGGDGMHHHPGPSIYFGVATGVYCVCGALAGCCSNSSVRLLLFFVAHIALMGGERMRIGDLEDGIVSGVVLGGFLAIPFGWAWFVLVKDWFRKEF
jgi:hypothetical protein